MDKMVQGDSTVKSVMLANRRKNPSQQAESASKQVRRRSKTKQTSRFEKGVKDALETSETLLSEGNSENKSHKKSTKRENSTKKDVVQSTDVKQIEVQKENSVTKDRLSSTPKLVSNRDLRKTSIGSHDSLSYRPLRPISGHSDRLVRPGSEDSTSSTMRQERERLSSRKDSSYSTYIEITHNASEDLIVVENAESDWSNSDENIPEVEDIAHLSSDFKIKPEVDEIETKEKEPSSRRKRRTRKKKMRDKSGQHRSKSANDKDELDTRDENLVVTDIELITQEVAAEPVYVPHDIWVPKRRMRTKGKQTIVRVGGGFMDLSYYLHYHVPIKVYQPKPYAQLLNNQMFMIKSKRPGNSAIDHKQYDRPSWTTMNKGFKASACI